MEYQFGSSISVSLSGKDETELRGYWDKLSDNDTVIMPIDKAPWDDIFNMCADKYGTNWLVNVNSETGQTG